MKAVVQLRGEVNVQQTVRDTLDMLNIHGVNHCALIPETDSYSGMIIKVNDVVAFGEPSVDTLAALLRRRAEPAEGRTADVDDEWIAENTDYDDADDLAQALVDEETTLAEQGLSPTLRLHPPRGGHEGIKHHATTGGQLGPHTTEEIDTLLGAMR